MQLDYQQFLSKLGKLTYLRPIPDHDYVEVYIKAYYLTENDMEKWIQEHRVCDIVMTSYGYWEVKAVHNMKCYIENERVVAISNTVHKMYTATACVTAIL